MADKELGDFLRRCCKERGLSLRGLSINAGLSPGTVHNILTRQYQPTVFTLNRLADYLGVKRQYLWQLAGLLDDMDYGKEIEFHDPRLKFHFAQIDKLPEPARNMVIDILKSLTTFSQLTKRSTESIPEN